MSAIPPNQQDMSEVSSQELANSTQAGGARRDPAAVQALTEQIDQHSQAFRSVIEQVGHVIVGQQSLVHRMVLGMLAGGHLLIEGVPGLAKTTAVASLAKAVRMSFQRLQFTPDLLPADLIGTQVFRPQEQSFVVQKGPIFANLILADEINRAPAKVQSALLEAMQEQQVTIGGETFALPEPFLVMATQNPVEQEGTYALPEAQTDRFMFNVIVNYPNRDEELQILRRMSRTSPRHTIESVTSPEKIARARQLIDEVFVDEKIEHYIVDLIMATRAPEAYGLDMAGLIQYGGSPRATIQLTIAAKATAFLAGRGYVTPADVQEIAMDVLRHRVIVTYEAEAEDWSSEAIVRRILDHLAVP